MLVCHNFGKYICIFIIKTPVRFATENFLYVIIFFFSQYGALYEIFDHIFNFLVLLNVKICEPVRPKSSFCHKITKEWPILNLLSNLSYFWIGSQLEGLSAVYQIGSRLRNHLFVQKFCQKYFTMIAIQ